MTHINSIKFQNFRCLRDCELPLARMTLLIGPNGSGKSTVFHALDLLRQWAATANERRRQPPVHHEAVHHAAEPASEVVVTPTWQGGGELSFTWLPGGNRSQFDHRRWGELSRSQVVHLSVARIRQTSGLVPDLKPEPTGYGLAGVLVGLKLAHPERFEALETEFCHWLPEFDRIVPQPPDHRTWRVALRTRRGGHHIDAERLSEGTLLALALLTIAWLPDPPSVVCIEEPDRGIHPRLLRDVQQALYRLTHPEAFGDTDRQAVQVIATTHCPYLLDLFRETPEEVVVASKDGLDVSFKRLVDIENFEALVQDSHLGEAWYSGILGGVPQ